MKKLMKMLAAVIVGAAFMGSVAGAQSPTNVTCSDISISNTGPGSNNTITCNTVVDTTITCTNNVIVGSANIQTSTTGNASGQNNTTVGNINTGTAVNYNGTNTTIGASCGSTATPSTPVTPAGNGGVAPTPAGVGATVLPNTSGMSTGTIVAYSLLAAAAIVAISRLAVAAFRRYSVK